MSYRGNPYCGGQGVYLYYLAKALADRGHQVTAMVGPPYPLPMPWARLIKIANLNFINRAGRAAIPSDHPLSALAPGNLAELVLSRIGSNPEMLSFSLRAFQALRQMLEQGERIDLVHDNQSLGYGLLLIQRLGIPVVATIHHPLQVDRKEDLRQMPEFFRRFRRALYYPLWMQKLVARRVNRLVTVSDISRDLIARTYRIPAEKIETVPNGVDLEIFRPNPAVAKVPGRVLFVGSSEDRKKGILYLLRALKRINDPAVRLTIVDGRLRPERVYAKNLAQELGLGPRVAFLEKISRDQLILEYNKAEVVVMPSLFEGFGLPALEAMATGTALIASRAGALPEVVGEEGGVLFEPGNDRELAEKIIQLLDDAGLRKKLGELGRKRAEQGFGWERVGQRLETIYQEELGKKEERAWR